MAFGEDGTFLGGTLTLSEDSALTASFFSGNQDDMSMFKRKKDNQGLEVEYKTNLDHVNISVQTGLLTENSGLLGSSFNGGYGNLKESLTYFSGLDALISWKKANFSGSFFVGQTKPKLYLSLIHI